VIAKAKRLLGASGLRACAAGVSFLVCALAGAPPASAAPPSAVCDDSGRQLIEQHGCTGCHTIGGSGGNLAPNLAGVVERRGADYVRAKIHNPKATNPSSIMPRMPFTDAQIAQILACLESGMKDSRPPAAGEAKEE